MCLMRMPNSIFFRNCLRIANCTQAFLIKLYQDATCIYYSTNQNYVFQLENIPWIIKTVATYVNLNRLLLILQYSGNYSNTDSLVYPIHQTPNTQNTSSSQNVSMFIKQIHENSLINFPSTKI